MVELTIDSVKPIYKCSDLTFIYDHTTSLNYDYDKIISISKILDLGFKFVPNFYSNELDFFKFLLCDLDNSFYNFNKRLFLNVNNNSSKDNNVNTNNNNISNSYFDFNKIYKSLKCSNNFKNINLNFFYSNTLEFRYDLYKLISLNKLYFSKNFSDYQLTLIKEFIKNKPFTILQSDKNTGFLLISNDNFQNLSKDHLFSSSTYKLLDNNPLEMTVNNINDSLNSLYNCKHISKKLFNLLKIKNINDVKLGSFRLLPKLHKSKFGIRPIINCIGHPTSRLCYLIDLLLQPFILQIETILKDSQNLIQLCNTSFSTSNMFLYSCDFDSLYTNIKHSHALDLLTNFISPYLTNNEFMSSLAFRTLLDTIFKNNTFSFDNMYFLQQIGIPMGCKCGPSIANLFLYLIEKSWLNIYSPLIYARYIDDIFYASDSRLDVIAFQKHFDYLKLNIVEDTSVNFLDLKISFNSIINKFEFSLYTKPTNTFSYLLPSSNHPLHIFKNIPKSLFIRIRRICTSYIDYLFHSRNLFVQLLKRNYNPKDISIVSHIVDNMNRDSLIAYKSKENSFNNNNNLFFFSKFDNSLPVFKQLICSSSNSIFSNQNIFIKYISIIQNNLGSILIHNKKLNYNSNKCVTSPCNINKCNSCKFVNSSKFIKINNFIIPILCSSSCLSNNIVYIIICNKCNYFYIGESKKKAKERIYQHVYSIFSFSKNLDKRLSNFDNCSVVAEHFSKKDHSLSNFSFLIFQKDLIDLIIRRSIEADLINLFLKLNQKLLNKHIPNVNNIKQLCFK